MTERALHRVGRRRIAGLAAVLAAALMLAAGCTGDEDGEPDTTPTSPTQTPQSPTPDGEPTTPDGEDEETAWARCTNPEHGFSVPYPPEWVTNEEPIDSIAPCSLFDPDPGKLRTEGMDIPADISVRLSVEGAPFEEATGGEFGAEVLDRQETTINGRAAVRRELRSTGEALYPEGWRYTVWAIDLDGLTFLGQTFEVAEPDYARTQEVLDEMVASVSIDEEALASCSAEDLDTELTEQPELPEAVAATRTAIAEAAVRCDYEALAELTGEEFTFSFGVNEDPAGHWRRREVGGQDGQEPLRYLVELLDRPFAVIDAKETFYTWPSAFAYDHWEEVPEAEREALKPLYDEESFENFAEFGGYIGYRIGITDDGTWRYFVAGD